MSYNGQVNFGLIGDYDAMADLDRLAADLDASLQELVALAPGANARKPRRRRRSARRPATAPGRRRSRQQLLKAEVAHELWLVALDEHEGRVLDRPGPRRRRARLLARSSATFSASSTPATAVRRPSRHPRPGASGGRDIRLIPSSAGRPVIDPRGLAGRLDRSAVDEQVHAVTGDDRLRSEPLAGLVVEVDRPQPLTEGEAVLLLCSGQPPRGTHRRSCSLLLRSRCRRRLLARRSWST